MAIDLATFGNEFPEFRAVIAREPAFVNRTLRAAQLMNDPLVFKTAYQDVVFLHAAHQLAMSPHGENLKLKDGTTVYWQQYVVIRDSRRPRVMVGGGFGDGICWPVDWYGPRY